MKLEFVESLILAHPFIKGFDQVSHCVSEDEVSQVAEGQISEVIAKRTKTDIENITTAKTVYSTAFYIGLLIQPKPSAPASVALALTPIFTLSKAGSTGPRRLDISYPTTEFTKLVKLWEKYDENTMGIVVRHIKW